MQLYQYKNLNLGFIILAPDHNQVLIKSTVRSIVNRYPESESICIVPSNVSTNDLVETKNICQVYKGKTTFTSLINVGMAKTKREWNLIIIEGTWIKTGLDKKYSYFIDSTKDVLYPLVIDYDIQGRPSKIYQSFEEATINGILMHKDTFKEVGKFTDDSLEMSKLIWAATASEAGVKFKAISGIKLC